MRGAFPRIGPSPGNRRSREEVLGLGPQLIAIRLRDFLIEQEPSLVGREDGPIPADSRLDVESEREPRPVLSRRLQPESVHREEIHPREVIGNREQRTWLARLGVHRHPHVVRRTGQELDEVARQVEPSDGVVHRDVMWAGRFGPPVQLGRVAPRAGRDAPQVTSGGRIDEHRVLIVPQGVPSGVGR